MMSIYPMTLLSFVAGRVHLPEDNNRLHVVSREVITVATHLTSEELQSTQPAHPLLDVQASKKSRSSSKQKHPSSSRPLDKTWGQVMIDRFLFDDAISIE